MTHIESFATTAASWQSFYLLTGEAAATLIGLMFVALTFGASLVTAESAQTSRAFVDPPFYHFAYVLFTACLFVFPTLTATALGIALLVMCAMRCMVLVVTFRRMRFAQQNHGDLELSDWVQGVILPLAGYLIGGVSGIGFLYGYSASFTGLAIATLMTLVVGVVVAWELMMWMVLARATRDKS
jgi:hypothetical protein